MKNNNHIAALSFAIVAMYFSFYGDVFAISLPPLGASVSSSGFYFGSGGGAAGGIAKALCTIASWFQGGVGQAIASLAIIFLGISAFFGKTTWGTALMFAVGIFAIFGSADIVKAIVAGTSGDDGWKLFLSSSGWGVSFGSSSSCGGF
jgi:type IV secretory pathway VirB2 component (pilin)